MIARFPKFFAVVVLTVCGAGASAAGAEVMLAGTNWQLLKLGPTGALDSAPATLSFSKDGKVSGNGGCNSFEGSYTVSGMTLTIDSLTAGKKMCGDDVNAQEASLLKALGESKTFFISATRLSINTAMWNEPLSFVPVE
jgi:heat shock protein HslJ